MKMTYETYCGEEMFSAEEWKEHTRTCDKCKGILYNLSSI